MLPRLMRLRTPPFTVTPLVFVTLMRSLVSTPETVLSSKSRIDSAANVSEPTLSDSMLAPGTMRPAIQNDRTDNGARAGERTVAFDQAARHRDVWDTTSRIYGT